MKNKSGTNVKFIIFAPKGMKTGGPEGMHQLAWALNTLGQEAVLLPWPKTQSNSSVIEYEKYKPKWCRIFNVRKKDILIVSENIRILPFWYLFFISKSRIYMWMHSVDFSLDKELNQYERKTYPINSKWEGIKRKDSQLKTLIINIGALEVYHRIKYLLNFLRKKAFKKQIQILPSNYLSASYYSQQMVKKFKNSNSDILLRGWVNGAELKSLEDIVFCSCKNYHVSFNPGKSRELISKILEIDASKKSTVHFVPIANLKTDREVYKILAFSDLYLDLGFFPGQERTPREAIRMGSPVLLAKRGAARYYEDFPLSDNYLMDLSLLDPEQTYEKIVKILSVGKTKNFNNQKKFREVVMNEKNTFLNDVKRFARIIIKTG